ncbi:alpha/beta hydrolase [Geodermatophilus sp. TF02-6]|uniref:esterase/lipase family protein n=1 Tax=Geodermatophilus sp. TF02-6 TaxID=2250575 RepID=UPI000DE9FA41|nr:alpha/beta hydrolase [Geodermatophilus sp. TF02-6]RBY83578.1 alpha/beta hydrolase [Geodermatophilus sp. TF02-6]
MARPNPSSARRRRLLAATEPARAVASAGALAAALPLLRLAPRGEPHPVLVLPGLLASDASTTTLRRWLRGLGYPVVGWELGRNRGPTPQVVGALPGLVERLADQHGTPVSVVGQSLGGIFARRLALRVPQQVRQVVTLGSPFRLVDRPDDSPGARVYRRYRPLHGGTRISSARGEGARPLPVPSTSVYSRWDGVVDWRACLQEQGPRSENVEVHASHLGMGHDPAVLWVVADRLAQTREGWRPFTAPTRWGLGRLFPRSG